MSRLKYKCLQMVKNENKVLYLLLRFRYFLVCPGTDKEGRIVCFERAGRHRIEKKFPRVYTTDPCVDPENYVLSVLCCCWFFGFFFVCLFVFFFVFFGGGSDQLFLCDQHLSQRAIRTSLENQLDLRGPIAFLGCQ